MLPWHVVKLDCMLTFSLGWTFKSRSHSQYSGNTEPVKTESTTTEDANKVITGVWKNRKPESRIGTGMGTGTGTGTGNSNGTETAM